MGLNAGNAIDVPFPCMISSRMAGFCQRTKLRHHGRRSWSPFTSNPPEKSEARHDLRRKYPTRVHDLENDHGKV
jgi:hypothetical protein